MSASGFPYHLHPVVAGVHLLWLAAAVYSVERVARRVDDLRLVGAAVSGCALLGYQITTETRLSEAMRTDWYSDRLAGGAESERFLRHYNGGDYFAWDLRQAADFVRNATRADDRVQEYGMDPYVLFMSDRLSVTPYIYDFELNVDSALAGQPSERDRDWMIRTAAENAHDLYVRIVEAPPAAFLTLDLVPYTFPPDADEDFARHCPEAAAFVRQNYHLARRFGTVRVWLRADRG